MQFGTGTKVVLLDALLAVSNLFLFWVARPRATDGEQWVAGVVAVVASVLFAVADRSRFGLWALVGAGFIAIAALFWTSVNGPLHTHLFAWCYLGLAVAIAANRFCFGVVRPVPEERRRRMDPSGWVDE